MTWTGERVELLKELWEHNLTFEQIAVTLGTTRGAVGGKLSRLGLYKPPKTPKPPKPRRKRERKPTPWQEIETAPPISDADIPLAQRRTLMQLRANDCRWPVGDPGDAGFLFCAATAVADKPYCAAHCRVAYQAPGTRRERRPFIPMQKAA